MKIISEQLGRSVLLIPLQDVISLQGIDSPEVLRKIQERYAFAHLPTIAWDQIQQQGVKLAVGKFITSKSEAIYLRDFTIFNDGLAAGAQTTEAAELFLEDLLQWGKKTFGFRKTLNDVSRRLYLSEIVVEFDNPIANILRDFSVLSTLIEGKIKSTYGINQPYQLMSFKVDTDKSMMPAGIHQIAGFNIEQRLVALSAGAAPIENIYTCQAPLRTKDHLELLKKIEQLLVLKKP